MNCGKPSPKPRGGRTMIDKEYGGYCLTCDICGEEVDGFDDYYDAVEYKKDNGWISRKIDGEWHDICPDCKESR